MQISRLGTLRSAIEMDTKGLHSSISGAKADFKSFGEKVPGYVKPVSLALLGMGTATVTALSALVFSAGKMGDELDKMSLRTGVAVEDLSGLSYAAKISGTDMTAMETSIRFLNRRMDESSKGIGIAKEAFEKLGVSVTDSEGKMRPSIDVMKEVADGIVALESETEKGATAMDIFGARSGPQLLPLLKQGSAGIDELTDKAAELGLIVSEKAAKASAEFTDRLTEVKESAKVAGFELGSVFLPAVTDLLEKTTGLVGRFNKLDESTQSLIGWGTAGGAALATITGGAGLLLTQLPKMAKGWELLRASAVPHIAAIGAAVLSVAWAVNETRKAIKDWRDGTTAAEQRMDSLLETTAKQVEASEMLREKLYELRDAGIDPMNVSVGLLGVDMDKLNELLGTNIQETANAAELTNRLAEIIKRAQERIKGFSKEEDQATESTKDWDAALAAASGTVEKGEKAVLSFAEEQEKSFGRLSFLETDQTQKRAWEIKEREKLDEEYLEKIRRNHQRRLASAEDTLNKESELIREHYDAREESYRLDTEYVRRASDKGVYWREQLTDKSIKLTDRRAEHNARYHKKVETLQEGTYVTGLGYVEALTDAELSAIDRRLRAAINAQEARTSKFEGFLAHEIGSVRMQKELVDREYEEMKRLYIEHNESLVSLDQWRADEIAKIEGTLNKSRLSMLDDYYVSYDEKVRSHEELFGGAMSGLLRGRSIYEGMDPEYRQRLNYGLAQQVFFPEEATPQAAPAAITEPYSPGGATGGQTININIQNVYGGDEAWANEFAEDIGRRIREQNIQL